MKRNLCFALALSLVLMLTYCKSAQAVEQDPDPSHTLQAPALIFDDVAADAWHGEAIAYCKENGLMTGTSDGLFSPEEPMDRAMIAAVLWRLDGSRPTIGHLSFSDVGTDAWYREAVLWATQSGVAGGYSDAVFGSNDPVTREQIAVMLYRFAQLQNSQGEPAGNLTFADGDSISAWAYGPVLWAADRGIISGKPGNLFDPGAKASRGEVAVMIHRYLSTELPNTGSSIDTASPEEAARPESIVSEDGLIAVTLTVGDGVFPVNFYDNASAHVIIEQMPLTIEMGDYAGQEKVTTLPYDFPSADTERPDTIQAGELYLWSGNQLVLFYTTFQNSYSGYVPIGFMEDTSGLTDALGSGSVSITLSLKETS